MKIAYAGYDVFLTAFQMTLACKCQVMKLFTFPVDGLTETNEKIKDVCQKNNIPVFLKSSLAGIMQEELLQQYPWEGANEQNS